MSSTDSSTAKPDILKWASSKDGEFRRQVSSFRNTISKDPNSQFPAELNRYHLYVCLACPWAHRTLIVRALKGLEHIISVSVVDWHLGAEGWKFTSPEQCPGSTKDDLFGSKYLKEIYFKAEPQYAARFTVPVLWDKKASTIVSNESSEIIRMMNESFDEWAQRPGLTFYPPELSAKIDEVNAWVYDQINNGVYKSGFATTQTAYENNVVPLFKALDKAESILATSTWLTGGTFTEADIRLFVTILRFDPVYHTHFRCNLKTISHDYPNILKWARKIYQIPKIAETVNMEHIKKHYYLSHAQINPQGIVPLWNGPDLDLEVDMDGVPQILLTK